MMDLGEKDIENKPLNIRFDAIKNCLSDNNDLTVILFVEDEYNCLDYVGKFSIDLINILEKGKPSDKKYKKDVSEFGMKLHFNLRNLYFELKNKSYKHSKYIHFKINKKLTWHLCVTNNNKTTNRKIWQLIF